MARRIRNRRLSTTANKSSFNGKSKSSINYAVLEPRKLLAADSDVISKSPDGQWLGLATSALASQEGQRYIQFSRFGLFDLQEESLAEMLVDAPLEFTPGYENLAVTISVPRPDLTFARFRVVEAPIMEPELAAQFPDIKTYRGTGIDDPSATIRLDTTMHGFHAQVLSPNGTWYVDPYFHLQTAFYASYFRDDAQRNSPAGNPDDIDNSGCGNCGTCGACMTNARRARGDGPNGGQQGSPAEGGQETFGTQLRTFRLANAATGEYTAFHGGTQAAGQAAIVTAINRVTGLYEKDLAIRLTLVSNNANLVYTNAGTDPYTNNNGSTMLGQNQTTVDAVIGNVNYDIGHVFSTGGGGIAGLGVVGFTGNKARGVTGQPAPVGDPFYIDYVAHEMGHQFNGNHSFNGCGGGGGAPSAQYEPGSGSTIMSYAGICGSDNLQSNSDAMFNFYSIQEIRNFITFTIPGVGPGTGTGNSVPTVNAGLDKAIPTGTPFELTAVGSDANAGQTLTYSWEQRDLGPSQALTAADNGQSPLFRVWNPTTSPTRVFPRLSNLVNNTVPIGEKLPTVARPSMDFRVVVRDNASGGGGVNWDDMVVNVVNTGAAFSVTSPNTTGITWNGGTSQNVTWNVAGTSTGTINTPNVDIWLSTDGGLTYPTLLAAATPNDGTHAITVPNISTTQARIKVKGTNNIFFDISNFNLTIVPGVVAHVESGTVVNVNEAGVLVSFAQPFTDPIVIVSPATDNFPFPVFASVADVTTTGFRIHADAWVFDTEQPFNETFSYMVFERGTIDLGGGARIVAGRTSAEDAFGPVTFAQPFGTVPAIVPTLVASVSASGRTARLSGTGTTGFQLRTQQEENPGFPLDEVTTVNYVAMTPGRYTIGTNTIEAGLTANVVTHNPFQINFSQPFAGLPVFTAHMQTFNEADSAVLRRTLLATTAAAVYIDEEDSLDPETNHAAEVVGYIALRNSASSAPGSGPEGAPEGPSASRGIGGYLFGQPGNRSGRNGNPASGVAGGRFDDARRGSLLLPAGTNRGTLVGQLSADTTRNGRSSGGLLRPDVRNGISQKSSQAEWTTSTGARDAAFAELAGNNSTDML